MIAAELPADEVERVDALHELGVLDTPPEERFDRVTRLCQRLFGVPMAFVNLVDADRQWTKSAAGLRMDPLPREQSFCAHAILDEAGMVVEDTASDARFADNPLVHGDPPVRFYAGVPLEAPGGQRVGTLCIADTAPRSLSAADRVLLRDLSLWVSKELSLDEELDRAAEVQRALFPARPLGDPRWEVAGACRPSREVGGDFYDWHRAGEASHVALGDVMGKGMPAAILMASVRAALRAGARRTDPAEGMRTAAEMLADELEATATFATAVSVRLADDGRATCVDAGHGHGALLRAGGGSELLEHRGFPLGIDVGERYVADALELAPGDTLVLMSDGLLELPRGPRDATQAAELARGARSCAEAVNRILGVAAGESAPDDLTAVVIRRAGA